MKRVRERQGSRVREVANRKGKSSIFLRFFLAVSAFPVSAKAYANISPASGKMAKQRNGAHPAWLNKWIFDSSVKSRSIGVRRKQFWRERHSKSGGRKVRERLRSRDPLPRIISKSKVGRAVAQIQ